MFRKIDLTYDFMDSLNIIYRDITTAKTIGFNLESVNARAS